MPAEQAFAVPTAAPTAKRERRAAAQGDSRVRIISPADGQVFGPGDTVNATVQLTAALAASAGWVAVPARGIGILEGTNYNGSTYQVNFLLPDDYAGPLELTPDIIDSSGNPIEGVGVTIIVRPLTAPVNLRPVQAWNLFFSIGQKGNIYVRGEYPGGGTLDLTSSVSGTVYESNDPHVVSVDAEGHVESTGWGTASVRATNQGAKAFFTFAVEDVKHPLPPQDVTAQVRFEKAPLTLDAKETAAQHLPIYIRTITVINTSGWPVVGPLYLAVRDLPRDDGRLWAARGEPQYFLNLEPEDGETLAADERTTASLAFRLRPTQTEPNYGLGLVRCSCVPGYRAP